MITVEMSPGGVGFIRTAVVGTPGIPATARRQAWVTGEDESPAAAQPATRRAVHGDDDL